MPTTADQRSRWLEPGALVVLYDLDLTEIASAYTGQPGPILRFHGGTKKDANEIFFGGHTYTPFPIKADSFEWNVRGTLPRPKLSVSNIGSVVSALLREFNDLVGATIVQRRTFAAYCLGGSEYDPSNWREFTPQIFVVERKVSETATACSFELASPMDAEGVELPRRQFLATACPFTFRGVECGYPAPTAGGLGWPVMNRLGKVFPGHFTDGVVPSTDLTLLQSATASFHTVPSHLSDVGKVVFGNNFIIGTKVLAVHSATQVKLTVPAKTSGSGKVFDIPRIAGRFVSGATGLPQLYNELTNYQLNDAAYVMVKGVRVYAVSKENDNVGHSVYDENFWMLDVCLKKLVDCELHFGARSTLPYGGWPGANKLAG